MALGTLLTLRGTVTEWIGLRQALRSDPARILVFLIGFRQAIIGLGLIAIGAARAWHIPVLLVIGGEETLEGSVHIYAVRRGRRLAEKSGPKVTN